jgi:hypothetical protein
MAHINVRSCSQLGSAELGDDAHQRKLRACCLHVCVCVNMANCTNNGCERCVRAVLCPVLGYSLSFVIYYLRSGTTLTVCCLRVHAHAGQ